MAVADGIMVLSAMGFGAALSRLIYVIRGRVTECSSCVERRAAEVMLEKQQFVIAVGEADDRKFARIQQRSGRTLTVQLDETDWPLQHTWLDEDTLSAPAEMKTTKLGLDWRGGIFLNAYSSWMRRRALTPWWRRRWVR